MSTKQEHLDFIKPKGKFIVNCNHSSFSLEEIEMLEKYGHWFNALTSGELKPITDSQQRFILVADGKEDPFTPEEFAWVQYLTRKAYEARRRDGVTIQYHMEESSIYTREMVKQNRSTMSKVIREIHRNL